MLSYDRKCCQQIYRNYHQYLTSHRVGCWFVLQCRNWLQQWIWFGGDVMLFVELWKIYDTGRFFWYREAQLFAGLQYSIQCIWGMKLIYRSIPYTYVYNSSSSTVLWRGKHFTFIFPQLLSNCPGKLMLSLLTVNDVYKHTIGLRCEVKYFLNIILSPIQCSRGSML